MTCSTGCCRLAVLAVGTRGDVQPLLALSIALKESIPGCEITLITHGAHQAWLREPAEAAGLQLHFLASKPARVWEAAAAGQASKRKLPEGAAPERGSGSSKLPLATAAAAGATPAAAEAAGAGACDPVQHREELIVACAAALGRTLPCSDAPAATGAAPHSEQPLPLPHDQQHAAGSGDGGGTVNGSSSSSSSSSSNTGTTTESLIIFNLFALEGFHIAEALGVPCLAASPCLVPYPMPPGYERRFQRAHPQLFRRLQAADEAQLLDGSSSGGAAASVGWSHVRHWLWPLFTERWGAWRYHRLGLPAVPHSECPPNMPLPPPPTLLYGVSECVVPQPGYWPASVHMCGYWHNRRCFPARRQQQQQQELQQQLLSPAVLQALTRRQEQQQQQQQHPTLQCEAAAGAAQQKPPLAAAEIAAQPATGAATAEAVEAVAVQAAAPICVDFGSMGLMGLLPQPLLLAAVLEAAARRLQRQLLLLTASWQPLLDACRQLEQLASAADLPAGTAQVGKQQQGQPGEDRPAPSQQAQQRQASQLRRPPPWLLPLELPVAHDWLLPRCAALLHHGGAGTVAAALRCGTPQLVCPLHFDQQQWAERVAWLGCGAQLSPAALLQAGSSGTGGGSGLVEGGTAAEAAASQEAAAGPAVGAAGVAADHADGRQHGDAHAQEPGLQAQQQQQLPLQQQRQHEVEQAAEDLAAALAGLLADSSSRQQCADMQQQLAAEEDGLAAAVQYVRQQLERQQAAAAAAAAGGSNPVAAVPPAARPPAAAPPAPVRELLLPGGLQVLCISAPEALFIHREIFRQDCYRLAGARLAPGSIVVDAGANIGLFALRLLLDRQLEPAVQRVYAFEPLPPCAEVLEANLRQHGVADKVSVLRCGLHTSPGSLPFTFYPAMPGNSTARPAEKWRQQWPGMAALMGRAAADSCFQGASRVECPVTSLAHFARDQKLDRIDLLKVDVEGCELEVLQGMDGDTWHMTRQVVAEVHAVGDRLTAVRTLLESQGFTVDAEEQQTGPAGNWILSARRSSLGAA